MSPEDMKIRNEVAEKLGLQQEANLETDENIENGEAETVVDLISADTESMAESLSSIAETLKEILVVLKSPTK